MDARDEGSDALSDFSLVEAEESPRAAAESDAESDNSSSFEDVGKDALPGTPTSLGSPVMVSPLAPPLAPLPVPPPSFPSAAPHGCRAGKGKGAAHARAAAAGKKGHGGAAALPRRGYAHASTAEYFGTAAVQPPVECDADVDVVVVEEVDVTGDDLPTATPPDSPKDNAQPRPPLRLKGPPHPLLLLKDRPPVVYHAPGVAAPAVNRAPFPLPPAWQRSGSLWLSAHVVAPVLWAGAPRAPLAARTRPVAAALPPRRLPQRHEQPLMITDAPPAAASQEAPPVPQPPARMLPPFAGFFKAHVVGAIPQVWRCTEPPCADVSTDVVSLWGQACSEPPRVGSPAALPTSPPGSPVVVEYGDGTGGGAPPEDALATLCPAPLRSCERLFAATTARVEEERKVWAVRPEGRGKGPGRLGKRGARRGVVDGVLLPRTAGKGKGHGAAVAPEGGKKQKGAEEKKVAKPLAAPGPPAADPPRRVAGRKVASLALVPTTPSPPPPPSPPPVQGYVATFMTWLSGLHLPAAAGADTAQPRPAAVPFVEAKSPKGSPGGCVDNMERGEAEEEKEEEKEGEFCPFTDAPFTAVPFPMDPIAQAQVMKAYQEAQSALMLSMFVVALVACVLLGVVARVDGICGYGECVVLYQAPSHGHAAPLPALPADGMATFDAVNGMWYPADADAAARAAGVLPFDYTARHLPHPSTGFDDIIIDHADLGAAFEFDAGTPVQGFHVASGCQYYVAEPADMGVAFTAGGRLADYGHAATRRARSRGAWAPVNNATCEVLMP
eukprot:TRINITY_DN3598_c1_g1_i1.p1 TRINITY_DN3598_c1_g1~~TRINITY_DN3598_c1_g1_i1.p1  ORF type:complete len:781 (+),score=174.32 TRINITY_DN3598_c1_g1_i1:67-2409(+)